MGEVVAAQVVVSDRLKHLIGCVTPDLTKQGADQNRFPVLLVFQCYLALMVMDLGRTSSALGRVMGRMPFSNSALALSAVTSVGRELCVQTNPNAARADGTPSPSLLPFPWSRL